MTGCPPLPLWPGISKSPDAAPVGICSNISSASEWEPGERARATVKRSSQPPTGQLRRKSATRSPQRRERPKESRTTRAEAARPDAGCPRRSLGPAVAGLRGGSHKVAAAAPVSQPRAQGLARVRVRSSAAKGTSGPPHAHAHVAQRAPSAPRKPPMHKARAKRQGITGAAEQTDSVDLEFMRRVCTTRKLCHNRQASATPVPLRVQAHITTRHTSRPETDDALDGAPTRYGEALHSLFQNVPLRR